MEDESGLRHDILLILLDSQHNESDHSIRHPIAQFRNLFNNSRTFSDATNCANFINEMKDFKAYMVVSGTLGEQIVPSVHVMPQLNSIYVFCSEKLHDEQWPRNWSKVKGIFTESFSLYKALKQATYHQEQDSNSVTIMSVDVTSKQSLDQLDASFMYTQLLKEIIFEINYDTQSVEAFVTHCRELYANNATELETVAKFEREYRSENAIWWYTYECFLYRMLNKALRDQEVGNLMKLGFFIRDLHQQLKKIHAQQYGNQPPRAFTVYRDQSISNEELDKLLKTPCGLISFNNFLSTSEDQKVSLNFGKGGQTKPGRVSVLFEMTIDTSISSTPFGLLDELSFFKDAEKEILFSTHSIFRIGEIKPVDESKQRWRVALALTDDNDPQLSAVTQCMRKETEGSTGWHRLGVLLMKIGEYDKAEDIYKLLLNQSVVDNVEKAYLMHHLGWTKRKLGVYEEALGFYEKARGIREDHLPSDHPDFIYSYNHIGDTYKAMADYTTALSNYEKALEICERSLRPSHHHTATCHNNIGDLYNDFTEYSKALSYYERALAIRQHILPPNHPDLATSNNNVGDAYSNMGEYSSALVYYEKALAISKKTLPSNHPDFATFYNNIGLMYDSMGEYTQALAYYEKALRNSKDSLSENHPHLVNFYNNIGLVYFNMGEFLQALSHYLTALNVCQKSLSENHPNLATSYNNIGSVYLKRGDYAEALAYYKKDLEISLKILPANHLDLGPSYNSMGLAYFNMKEHSEALLHYEKALEICKHALPPNHPSLASCYSNMGNVYRSMDELSQAICFYERALEIRKESLPQNHPQLAASYNNIGLVHQHRGDYEEALSFHERAVECAKVSLSENHPDLQLYQKHFDDAKHVNS